MPTLICIDQLVLLLITRTCRPTRSHPGTSNNDAFSLSSGLLTTYEPPAGVRVQPGRSVVGGRVQQTSNAFVTEQTLQNMSSMRKNRSQLVRRLLRAPHTDVSGFTSGLVDRPLCLLQRHQTWKEVRLLQTLMYKTLFHTHTHTHCNIQYSCFKSSCGVVKPLGCIQCDMNYDY